MAVVICDDGEIHLLNLMLKTALSSDESFSLHLFKNNITPDADSVVGDFVEASFTNYSSVTLHRATWGTPTITDDIAKTTYPEQSWTCGVTGNTIYGAYVLDGSGNLVWSDLFDDPKPLSENDVLNYTPVFSLSSAN